MNTIPPARFATCQDGDTVPHYTATQTTRHTSLMSIIGMRIVILTMLNHPFGTRIVTLTMRIVNGPLRVVRMTMRMHIGCTRIVIVTMRMHDAMSSLVFGLSEVPSDVPMMVDTCMSML